MSDDVADACGMKRPYSSSGLSVVYCGWRAIDDTNEYRSFEFMHGLVIVNCGLWLVGTVGGLFTW